VGGGASLGKDVTYTVA